MGSYVLEAVRETLWPTRCALCDKPGTVLCDACARRLDVIDLWQACPVCGAPWGRLQCDHCTPVVRECAEAPVPCVSALRYTARTAHLVKTYKDQGEQRLAPVFARLLANVVFPSWLTWADGVTYIPATRAARARRGFDHMEHVAEALADMMGLPCFMLLERPRAADQRELGRRARRQNVRGRFRHRHSEEGTPQHVILIDDVFTTGSTLADAHRALAEINCEARCATVARA